MERPYLTWTLWLWKKQPKFSCFSVICRRARGISWWGYSFCQLKGYWTKTLSLIPHTEKSKAAEKEIVFMPKIFTQKLGRHFEGAWISTREQTLVTHLFRDTRKVNQGTLWLEQHKAGGQEWGGEKGGGLSQRRSENVSRSLRWGWVTENSRVAPRRCVFRGKWEIRTIQMVYSTLVSGIQLAGQLWWEPKVATDNLSDTF